MGDVPVDGFVGGADAVDVDEKVQGAAWVRGVRYGGRSYGSSGSSPISVSAYDAHGDRPPPTMETGPLRPWRPVPSDHGDRSPPTMEVTVPRDLWSFGSLFRT
jgi:hypothetical protein